MITFLNLNRLNRPYLPLFRQELERLVAEKPFVLGEAVEKFEKEWANYTGARFAVGTGSGLDALFLVLEAWKIMGKISAGDEVIVPANTYIATVLAVLRAGLKPVLIEPAEDMNMPGRIPGKLITPRTKVLLPVHLYGLLAPMDDLSEEARKYNLLILEDAAQAHGASTSNKRAGAFGDAAAFSFYPTKNLGALGDGGMVTTDDKDLADLIKILRNYGQQEKYVSKYAGINSRLDALQALFLSVKLSSLDEMNRAKSRIAAYYNRNLTDAVIKPSFYDDERHVFHQYVIRTDKRDALMEFLKRKGVETIVHYPVPPHRQEALRGKVEGDFPFSEKLSETVLSLPSAPYLSEEELAFITSNVNAFFQNTNG